MDQTPTESLLQEASERYNDGHYAGAIALWQKVLELDASNQRAREGIRMALLLSDQAEASGPAGGGPALDPRVKAGIDRVRDLLERGQITEAVEGCRLLSEIAPDLEEVRRLAAQVARVSGAGGGGGTAENLEACLDKARKALAEGRNAQAAEAARAALKIEATSMEAVAILSFAGEEVASGTAVSGRARGVISLEDPHEDTAPVAVQSATVSGLIQQGQAALDAGRPQDAIDTWSRIFALDQSNAQAGALIERARNALEVQTRQIDDLFYEAADAYDAGRHEEALGLLQKVLVLSPHHREARSLMEKVQAALAGGGEKIRLDEQRAREVAAAKQEAASPAHERVSDAPIPLASGEEEPAYPPRVRAEAVTAGALRPQRAGPDREESAGGGGLKRLVAYAAGALLFGAVAMGAWLWFGSETGEITQAQATVPGEPRPGGGQPGAAPSTAPGAAAAAAAGSGSGATSQATAPVDPAAAKAQAAELRRQGREHYQRKRWAEAVLDFRKSQESDAVEFDAQELLDTAMAELEKQAHLEKEMSLATQYFEEGDYATALKTLYRLQQDHPEMKQIDTYILNSWYNWGVYLLQAGAMDEAAERFGEVLALDSQDGMARRAREVAVKYQRRQRDSSFDSYASTLELREMDER